MAWATAASFAELCMRRVRRVRSSKALSASSSTALRLPEKRSEPPRCWPTPTRSGPREALTALRSPEMLTALRSPEMLTALRSPEVRTQPMVPVSTPVSQQRSERRIAVRLPLRVRGRDKRGVIFEEETSSENLCRNGAAFLIRFDVAIGSDLEIRIPISYYSSHRV